MFHNTVELRSHLKSLGYVVNEEFGESNFDLLINRNYAIEIKKDPKLGEFFIHYIAERFQMAS